MSIRSFRWLLPFRWYKRGMALLFLLFTVVPFVELFLLIEIGKHVGAAPTVGLVILSGLVGAALARHEGVRVWRSWRTSLAGGRLPEEGIVSGLLVLVGAVLLIAPGVLTDLTGILLMLPPVRRAVAEAIRRRIARKLRDGTLRVVRYRGRGLDEGEVIEVEPEKRR